MYCNKFQNFIERTCVQIHPTYCPTVVSNRLSSHHYLPCDGQLAMEIPVRLWNYAECHLFSTDPPDRLTIAQYWNQGVGFTVAACGYSSQLPVLLQLECLAFLEVYRKTDFERYTNDQIRGRNASLRVVVALSSLSGFIKVGGRGVGHGDVIIEMDRQMGGNN